MCLRELSGGSYHHIRLNNGVSRTCVHEVADAIIAHPDLRLKFPTTVAAERDAAKSFEKLGNSRVMKGCVGAIDGWMCPIQVPHKNEVSRVRSFFSGHYQRYGVNVQAVGSPQSLQGWYVLKPRGTVNAVALAKWKLSSVVNNLPKGLYVVADNAYTNTNQVLIPLLRPRISTA
ncbi:hypothetical protein PC114_g16829 [Phytophthora cactorum]|nr:hypothetical protein PC114_g16829 [Phytophthora cactorum]